MTGLPRSLYADSAAAVPAPPLAGDLRVSVAIIGGGYTGLSTALHLAERGTSVAVLEAHEPGWGASGRNGGQVNPGLKHDPDEVERDFGPDLGGRMVAFAGAAPDRVFQLIARHKIECEARRSGTLRAAIGQRQAARVQASAAQALRRQFPVTLLDRDQTREATGTDRYACALRDPRGGSVNPLGYARGLAAAARDAGASIFGGSRAVGIERAAGGWRIATRTGTVSAETVVLATNGYTDRIWPGLRQTIVPLFSAILASAPLPPPLSRAILPARSVLYEASRVPLYLRIDSSDRLLIGGRSVSRELTDLRHFAYLREAAVRLFPETASVAWTHGWNGRVAYTADEYPHLHEPAPGFIACLGYSGRGIALATAMGALITRRIHGTRPEELELPITAPRAIRFHALWPAAVAARLAHARLLQSLWP